MQVYRGMDIGTAKPSPADRARHPHHLVDLADPWEEWNVARWAGEARRVVAEIERRGNRALVVGGTGLYFQALVDGFTPPGRYPQVRAELEAEPDTGALHRRLAVVRALEVSIGSGRPFSSFGPGVDHYPLTTWRIAGLWLPRRVIARRVEERFSQMIAAGLVDETDRLRAAGMAGTARQALGYREVLEHLEQGRPLSDAVDEAVRRTRSFARRQRVWWRRDPRIRWFGAADNPFAVSAQILGRWREP
jgi:tRNA dimethylallyltransferase